MINKIVALVLLITVVLTTTAEGMTLSELLDTALKNNPETQSSWWNAQRAAAQRELAKASYYPNMMIRGSADHGREYKFPNGHETTFTSCGADLILNYLLLDFGERCAANQAAIAALQAAQWQSDYTLQRILYDVLANTYAYLNAQEILQSRVASLHDAQVTFDAADQLYRTGLRSVNDVYAMKATIADMQIGIALQKAEADNARSRLAKSVGWAVDAPIEVQALPDPTIKSPLRDGLPQLMERSQQTRADLLARRADIEQKNALFDQASTKYLPKLNFNADGGYKHYEHDRSNGANYRLGLSLDIPLFNGFESIYQKRAAYADAQAAEADVENLEAEIALEVMTYHRSFEAAQEILLLVQDNLQNSIKTFEGILEKYKAGTQSIFDMTAAQRQLAEARIKQSEAKTRWYRTLAQLVYATGTISREEKCAN